MRLYRIAKRLHIRDLTGTGAMLYGGRWNFKGYRMLYTSESLSLSMLEIMANVSSEHLNKGFYCAELEIPDDASIERIKKLPPLWNTYPYSSESMQQGTQFLKNSGFCLKVPSTVIPSEFNFLLNPHHEDFDKVKLIDFRPILFDKRLFD